MFFKCASTSLDEQSLRPLLIEPLEAFTLTPNPLCPQSGFVLSHCPEKDLGDERLVYDWA